MDKEMEKEKNIIMKENYYFKVNIYMDEEMEWKRKRISL